MLRIIRGAGDGNGGKTGGGTASARVYPESIAAFEQHSSLISGYMQSHRIRNHASRMMAQEKRILEGWFESFGRGYRPLYTWEAMEPAVGRARIVDYGKALLELELTSSTIRNYLGILRRYFEYVLEHPFVPTPGGPIRIQSVYGAIDQPVSEYDYPAHVYDGEQKGVPFDPERISDFYAILREHYITRANCRAIAARNYAMVVLAGETGLRIDEILHLETDRDLFFESRKIQTRHAKGTRGSDKRSRVTLFSPLARDTIQFYLREHRGKLLGGARTSTAVFPAGRRWGDRQFLSYGSALAALREMIRVANQQDFRVGENMGWHWFRRIFATRFIERFPGKLYTLVELLGHSTPNTVHRYIRHSEAWQDKQLQEVLEKGATDAWQSIGD